MKRIFAVLVLLAISVAAVRSQACGTSEQTFEIEPVGQSVSYRLYYFAPKVRDLSELDNKLVGEFLREQLGNASLQGNFWQSDLVAVSAIIAERYLKDYNESDFSFIYDDKFRDHHNRQLEGEAKAGRITFSTREMDNTPFLMKLSSANRPDTYLVNAFLGGCHARGSKKSIRLAEKIK